MGAPRWNWTRLGSHVTSADGAFQFSSGSTYIVLEDIIVFDFAGVSACRHGGLAAATPRRQAPPSLRLGSLRRLRPRPSTWTVRVIMVTLDSEPRPSTLENLPSQPDVQAQSNPQERSRSLTCNCASPPAF
eukprot:2472630-Rhodomonas_salina.1